MMPDFQQFADELEKNLALLEWSGLERSDNLIRMRTAVRHARLLAKISAWANAPAEEHDPALQVILAPFDREVADCKAHVRALLGEPEEPTR